MAIEQGLRTLLLAQSSITSLLGDATKGVYLDFAPQGVAEPFIVISAVSVNPLLHLGGTGGLRFTSVDVDCKARTREAATSLAQAVETYIADYSGAAGSDTLNAVLLEDRGYDFEPPDGARQWGRFVETLDIQCQWTPA